MRKVGAWILLCRNQVGWARDDYRITGQTWWSRFVNSQFVQMHAIFGAQLIYIARTFASRGLTEGLISTATRRSSILAVAEDRSYVGRFVSASYGTTSITNKTDRDITLPAGAELLANDQTPLLEELFLA